MAYDSLPSCDGTEELDTIETAGSGIRSNRRQYELWYFIAIIVSAVVSLASLYVILDRSASAQPFDICGTSRDEALSRGCHFDVVSFTWVPHRCFDEELSNQFLALRDWEWFLDPEALEKVDVRSVLAGDHDHLYVTWEYHVCHCTYMWRKMHRAILKGVLLDGYLGSTPHTERCEMVLVDRQNPLNDTSTIVFTKFAECPVLEAGLGKAGWYRVMNGEKIFQSFERN